MVSETSMEEIPFFYSVSLWRIWKILPDGSMENSIFLRVAGCRNESLAAQRPITAFSGVSPADLAALMIYLERTENK